LLRSIDFATNFLPFVKRFFEDNENIFKLKVGDFTETGITNPCGQRVRDSEWLLMTKEVIPLGY